MALRIAAGENSRFRNDGRWCLRVGVLEVNGLRRKRVQVGGNSGFRAPKSHAVGACGLDGYQNDIGLSGRKSRMKQGEKTEEQQ